MKKILIVDDEEIFLEMLELHFSKEGYKQIFTASNGIDALKLVIDKKPDVILLDNRLPDFHGIEIIQLIKSKSPESIIILMTGYGDKKLALNSMDKGALDFILKPIDFDYLKNIFLSKNITPEG